MSGTSLSAATRPPATTTGTRASPSRLPHDPAIATRLAQNHVAVVLGPADDAQNWLTTLLLNLLPLVAYVFFLTWPLYRIARSLDALTERLDRHAEPSKE